MKRSISAAICCLLLCGCSSKIHPISNTDQSSASHSAANEESQSSQLSSSNPFSDAKPSTIEEFGTQYIQALQAGDIEMARSMETKSYQAEDLFTVQAMWLALLIEADPTMSSNYIPTAMAQMPYMFKEADYQKTESLDDVSDVYFEITGIPLLDFDAYGAAAASDLVKRGARIRDANPDEYAKYNALPDEEFQPWLRGLVGADLRNDTEQFVQYMSETMEETVQNIKLRIVEDKDGWKVDSFDFAD